MKATHPTHLAIEQFPYPRKRFIRAILRSVIGIGVHTLTRFRISGKEKLPQAGPLIVVTNHFHFLDALIVIHAMPWPLEFLADFQMPNVPALFRNIPDIYGTYKVAQGTANLNALHASEAVLAQNGVLGIFPEGRLHPPPLNPALPGAAFLALRSGVPILPVGIYTDHDWDIFGTIQRTGRRLKVTCAFGDLMGPFQAKNPARPERGEVAQAGGRIMTAIARLLPPEMRGEFSEDLAA